MNTDLSKSLGVNPQSAPAMIDSKFRLHWRNYLLQVGGATVYLIVALCLTEWLGNLAIVSAVAASAFLVFCLPTMPMSQPRRLLGGQIVALLVTLAASPLLDAVNSREVATDILAALAVGATMLVMAITNTEHPPAAGTALGLSLTSWDGDAALSVVVMVLMLIAIQQAARGRLINLL